MNVHIWSRMVIRIYESQRKSGENVSLFADALSPWCAMAFACHSDDQDRTLFVNLYTVPTVEELKLVETIEWWE